MLSLPETLMLFALHDERGTVFNAAFIGLDETLYAGVLGELMLRGAIRVRSDGTLRLEPIGDDCDSLLLLLAHRVLQDQRPADVGAALAALQSHMSKIRSRIIGALVSKGVLHPVRRKRGTAHEMVDAGPEATMLEHLQRGIEAGPQVSRRIGVLIGLVHALDLWSGLLPADQLETARARGSWVLERDAICRATEVWIQKLEGRWQP